METYLNPYEDWYSKVLALGKHMFGFTEDILEVYEEDLKRMHMSSMNPRAAVIKISEDIHYN